MDGRCKTQKVFVKTLLLNGEGDDGAAKLCPSMLSEKQDPPSLAWQALLSDRVKFELNCLMIRYVRLKAMGAMLQPSVIMIKIKFGLLCSNYACGVNVVVL